MEVYIIEKCLYWIGWYNMEVYIIEMCLYWIG
jgi:hypothetical protein